MVSAASVITGLLSCHLLIFVSSKNIALGAGGLKSIAVGTALTSSLLSLECDETSTLAESHFMEGIDTIISVSGGSWFAPNLIYSKKFVSMVEKIAASIVSSSASASSPRSISDIYNDEYSHIFDDAASSITGAGLPVATQITNLLKFAGYEISPNFMAAVYEKNGNPFYAQWSDLVEMVLVDDIPSNASLSYPPQEWAEGKIFAPVVMVGTPLIDGVALDEYMWIDTQRNGQKYQFIKYTAAFSDNPEINAKNRFFPARFSHVLGSNDGSSFHLHHALEISDMSPLPFAAPAFFDSTISYDGMDCKSSGTCDQIFSKTLKSSFDPKFEILHFKF